MATTIEQLEAKRAQARLGGGEKRIEAQHAKGGPEHPMTEDELRGKFTECAREALDAGSAGRALDTIEKLETVADIRPLCEILRS